MTVWVFGDSFAYLHLQGNTWHRQISNSLKQDLSCYATGGISLEYTYYQFNNVREDIKNNDIVIVALTNIDRRWLIKDRPNEQLWLFSEKQEDPDIDKAIENYLRYLDNRSVYETYLTNFLYNLAYITKVKDLKTIVLPCFDSSTVLANKAGTTLDIARGNLFTVSMNEFDPLYTKNTLTQLGDLRANHLTYTNHCVLANKILDYIHSGITIDLTSDFHKHMLNRENVYTVEYSKQEFFDVHENTEYWNLHLINRP